MRLFKFDPLTQRRFQIFKKNRLAMLSVLGLAFFSALSIVAPLIANDKPYAMKYQGKLYFPILSAPLASDLGLEGYLVDYRTLTWGDGDWAKFAPVRWNPFESNKNISAYPSQPTWENPMGTDNRGRDVFTRLLYGFRYSFAFALGVWLLSFVLGIVAGLLMGFFGGGVDFIGQRLVEIMSSIPQFFLLIILISIFAPDLWLLVTINTLFGWIAISYYMRAEALKIRKLEYIEAARAMGLPTWKVLFKHVLPNALTPIITFSPFKVAAGITALAALDYLGFGLAPPTPSWGELLNQAKNYFTTAWWLAFFPSMALFATLCCLNFVGDGLRNAFDPKQG